MILDFKQYVSGSSIVKRSAARESASSAMYKCAQLHEMLTFQLWSLAAKDECSCIACSIYKDLESIEETVQ